MAALTPKKLPRQARAQATFDVIVEACARLLREDGYAALTTNRIAERAGVSIGSLYEFFPNKEAIVAVLIERQMERIVGDAALRLDEALERSAERNASELLIQEIVDLVSSDSLFRVLLREVPFSAQLPAAQRALATALELVRAGAERAQDRVALPHLEADAWLIGRMIHRAVLDIAFADEHAPDRAVLTRELARLTFRMIHGRDPGVPPSGAREDG
jgi:AcrR family transcriptional regulator